MTSRGYRHGCGMSVVNMDQSIARVPDTSSNGRESYEVCPLAKQSSYIENIYIKAKSPKRFALGANIVSEIRPCLVRPHVSHPERLELGWTVAPRREES